MSTHRKGIRRRPCAACPRGNAMKLRRPKRDLEAEREKLLALIAKQVTPEVQESIEIVLAAQVVEEPPAVHISNRGAADADTE